MAKVLLVEDDNNLREIYEARLQAEGYQIATARDGEEALVVAKQEHPDLVISDVMMPKISGFEMLDILRNTDGLQAVKVIMLTALGQNDDQQRANQLGADRYLVKSQVTLEDIVRVAHELLGDTPAAAAPAAPAADDSATATDAAAPVAVSDDAAASTSDDTSTPADSVVPEPVAAESEPAAATDVAQEEAIVDTASESTAQEEAAVDAKIEDFVSGASSEATPPAGSVIEPEVATEPVAETAPAPVPAEPAIAAPTEAPAAPESAATPANENTENNDALLAEAVDKLVGNTAKPEPEPVSAEPASTAPVLPAAEESKGSVGGDKVITPLAATPASVPVVNDVVPPATPAPTTPATPPADPSDPNDPRNLAL
jgi:CheY-like chemotaxis protein